MMRLPFVSVVTPVYNGEAFLARCIEAVLAQTHADFEYIIVNNASTDRTLAIARSYAARDPRIRVLSPEGFVDAEENHNRCFRAIAPASAYCKVLSADDAMRPDALETLLTFAVAHPTAGIIGSYQKSGGTVKWRGLPESTTLVSGREACRRELLDDLHFFGTPTSSLYRADLVRRTPNFFPHSRAHADTSACFAQLHDCDYGFVHQVLSEEYVHAGQLTTRVMRLQAGDTAYLEVLLEYGPQYLSAAELAARKAELLGNHERFLGGCLLKFKGREFWEFQQAEFQRLGLPFHRGRLARAALRGAGRNLAHPVAAWSKLRVALAERQGRAATS